MPWWEMPVKAGLEFFSASAGYEADKAQYKAKKAWQAYSNTMVSLGAALNQNIITDNEIIARGTFAQEAFNIKRNKLEAEASVEVNAAAAGVKGRSVNQSLLDVQRKAAEKEHMRTIAFDNAMLGFRQQRVNTEMSAAAQKDYSFLPKPSRLGGLLQAGFNVYDLYGKMKSKQSTATSS
jgi:hypothetical protein